MLKDIKLIWVYILSPAYNDHAPDIAKHSMDTTYRNSSMQVKNCDKMGFMYKQVCLLLGLKYRDPTRHKSDLI